MNTKTIITVILFLLVIGGIIFYFEKKISWEDEKTTIESVIVGQDIISILNEEYQSSETEFVYCLDGMIKDNIVVIEEIYKPSDYNAEQHDIQFVSCKNTILDPFRKIKHLGTIHNHPSGICYLGQDDLYTFGKSNDALIGIICDIDEIKFFTSKNLIKSIDLEVEP